MALRWKIPCFVLFRHPLDAISSYLVREPGLTAQSCLDDYLAFAEATQAQIDHPLLFILTFEQVIADAQSVTEAILDQIGQPATVTPELIAEATRDKRAERHRSSLPNPEKEALKQKHLADIQALPGYARAVELFDTAKARRWQF